MELFVLHIVHIVEEFVLVSTLLRLRMCATRCWLTLQDMWAPTCRVIHQHFIFEEADVGVSTKFFPSENLASYVPSTLERLPNVRRVFERLVGQRKSRSRVGCQHRLFDLPPSSDCSRATCV